MNLMESEIVGNFVKVYLGLGLTIGRGDLTESVCVN